MRRGLNLRRDLAKLGDNELIEYFEDCLAHREWLASHAGGILGRGLYKFDFLTLFGRGPLHARFSYKLLGFLQFGPRNGESLGDLYITDCELKDVLDELKRRGGTTDPKKA